MKILKCTQERTAEGGLEVVIKMQPHQMVINCHIPMAYFERFLYASDLLPGPYSNFLDHYDLSEKFPEDVYKAFLNQVWNHRLFTFRNFRRSSISN